jgi:hypothetical protein
MTNHKPFRLIQNDNTRESWLWFPEEDRWHECDEEEFDALKSFAKALRDAEDPLYVLKYISTFVNDLGGSSD